LNSADIECHDGSKAMLDESDDFGNVGGEGEDTMVNGTHNKGNEVTECYPDPLLAYQDGYTCLTLMKIVCIARITSTWVRSLTYEILLDHVLKLPQCSYFRY
jgi:hypothetical protein